jgi:hypothetical protein
VPKRPFAAVLTNTDAVMRHVSGIKYSVIALTDTLRELEKTPLLACVRVSVVTMWLDAPARKRTIHGTWRWCH